MSAPIGMFGCTVESVYALAPEAERVTDGNNSRMPTPITEDTVAGWITDIDAEVAGALVRINLIGVGPNLTTLQTAARTVVANGAASYLEAARYPTRSSLNDTTYAGVLWGRYQAGVTALVSQLNAVIVDAGSDVGTTGAESGPFGVFPCTYFTDDEEW